MFWPGNLGYPSCDSRSIAIFSALDVSLDVFLIPNWFITAKFRKLTELSDFFFRTVYVP
jgi:hypothetical protein